MANTPIVIPGKRIAIVRKVRAAWRTLTGGGRVPDAERRTLVACSGGADSSALALALADTNQIVLAHVVHDMRPREDAFADRDAVAQLASALGVPFVWAEIRVHGSSTRPAGNTEARARTLRYAALAKLATENACPVVATAHHADDQLETILMRLLRGSGPRGLGAIPPSRRLAPGVRLIRPMLSVSRAQCEELCATSGWTWREDATNADQTRLRSAIRHAVVPALRAIRPDVASKAAQAASLQRAAARVLTEQALSLMQQASRQGDALVWERAVLADQPPIVLGELVRAARSQVCSRGRRERLSTDAMNPVIRAIRDNVGGSRIWQVAGLAIQIDAQSVRVSAASP
ncbi:MAG: tRNA lysidine(34) synthetase TilS [Planctomycetota bacterium]|nr:tRNA lysidine(34) synthetase TilS [Planctomycetota bacterium]